VLFEATERKLESRDHFSHLRFIILDNLLAILGQNWSPLILGSGNKNCVAFIQKMRVYTQLYLQVIRHQLKNNKYANTSKQANKISLGLADKTTQNPTSIRCQ